MATQLHVLLASDAPYAVVLWRRSRKLCCTIGWDRTNDTFELGQWLKGRLLAEHCDLSPDGRHLLYYAERDGQFHTVISRAPYLTALIYEAHMGTWELGRGVFVGNGWYRLACGGPGTLRSPACADLHWDRGAAELVPRACRSQWSSRRRDPPDEAGWCRGLEPRSSRQIRTRELSDGWRLESASFGGWQSRDVGGVRERFRLARREAGPEQVFDDWTWADRDRHRLVWASAGCLWSGQLDETGLRDERCLHDFNDMQFEPRVAPYEGYRSPRGGT